MKFLHKIAKECGISYDLVYNIVKNNDIETRRNGRLSLDEKNEKKLHRILFFGGWVQELTFESKLNNMI